MSDEKVRWLGDVQRLELKPGDRVVLTVPGPISQERMLFLRATLEKELAGHRVLILQEGMRLGVLGE